METILLIAEPGVKVGRVYPHLRLLCYQLLARQRHRLRVLRVHQRVVLTLLMEVVVLQMGTLFVEIGQTGLVALNTE